MSSLFESLGGDFVEPAIVVDAALPLELSGEMVRGRICVFTDENGQEWALRPDLTLPAAVDEIARRRGGDSGERTIRYDAPVFRLPTLAGEPMEFRQAGFERFGFASDAASDAEAFLAIAQAAVSVGAPIGFVQVGDLSVFPAFVDAMALAPETREGLKRAFRQEGGVRAFLEAERGRSASGLVQRMRGMEEAEVAAFVEEIFTLTGTRPVGERTGAEIVERLYQRAQNGAATDVSVAAKTALTALLEIDVEASLASTALRELAQQAGLSDLDIVLDRFEARLNVIAEALPDLFGRARFATRYGRRFTYYDGFVFELAASRDDSLAGRPFAAGGRYDSLLKDLSGGEIEATAMGGVIIPHRIERATGGKS